MKIACQSCQAKYTIADEKVLGRVVKIRCKKCGSTIVINGNEAADTALSPPDDATAVARGGSGGAFDYSAPQGDEWTVNVAEGDQRTMRLAEIVAEYKSGVVNDETYCWKDGMNDWLPLREIPALASACVGTPAAPSRFASQAPTAVTASPSPAFAAAAGGGYGSSASSNGNGSAGVFAQPSSNTTARRTGGRGAPGADLFGNVADAGGENDVMTSAPQGTPEAHDNGEAKLTGQRNENSVLFSLSALTSNAPKDNGGPAGAPQADGSGLIDIRALAGSMSTGTKEKASHVDDIMNLGGGGAFTAALAAPVLAAPPMESDLGAGAASQKSNKGLMIALGSVTVALLLVVVVLLVRKPAPAVADTTPTGTTSAAATAPATSVASADGVGGAHSAAPADSAAPPATAAPPDTAKPAAVAVANVGRPNNRPNPNTNNPGVGAPPPPPPPPQQTASNSFEDEMKKSLGKAPPAATGGGETGGGSSAQFDRGAAAAALGAVNVQACKKGDGPTGSGHVSITFSPNGSVSNVVADQPPYQGTAVGGCVAAKFRSARVPAFGGAAQKVGKSFSIN
jgi:predicted Zn finger-like uncharacterized protein